MKTTDFKKLIKEAVKEVEKVAKEVEKVAKQEDKEEKPKNLIEILCKYTYI